MRKSVVFITGAGGEIGHGLIAQLARTGARRIVTLDVNPLGSEMRPLVHREFTGSILDTALLERVLADLDEIYYKCKARWVFVADDNLVLDPARVMTLCDAIIARRYRKLQLVVQADCLSMAQNEEMVRKMSQAGIRTIFLGIENASKKNLAADLAGAEEVRAEEQRRQDRRDTPEQGHASRLRSRIVTVRPSSWITPS